MILTLLAGCGASANAPQDVPRQQLSTTVTETCSAGAPQPVIPHLPYTIKTLETYANDLRRALTITEDARTECSRILNRVQRGRDGK